MHFGLITSAGTGRYRRSTSATVNNDAWRHAAGSYDGSGTSAGIKIFVDGAEVATTSVSDTGTVTTFDTDFRIGITTGTVSTDEHFNGLIDDARVFDQALVEADATYLASRRGVVDLPGNPIAFRKRLLQMRGYR